MEEDIVLNRSELLKMDRRDLFRFGLNAAGAAVLAAYGIRPTAAWAFDGGGSGGGGGKSGGGGGKSGGGDDTAGSSGGGSQMPTSPLVGGYVGADGKVYGTAFTEEMPIPKPLQPSDPGTWATTRTIPGGPKNTKQPYYPGASTTKVK
jgi:hypothetical protein